MKIITVTGYKGGVAKSTTSVHLATYFSDKGKTVLLDGDPNRTAIAWSERGAKKCHLSQSIRGKPLSLLRVAIT